MPVEYRETEKNFPDCPTLNSQLSTLNTQHSTLNTQHSTLNTQHSTLNTQHSTLNTQHSTLNTQHSTLNTQHSTLNTQHSTLNTQHSTLNTQHSSLRSSLLLAAVECEDRVGGAVLHVIVVKHVVEPGAVELLAVKQHACEMVLKQRPVGGWKR